MSDNLSVTREAMDAMQIIEEIADLLQIGLDKETLSICVRLIENGVNPTPLAHSILNLKRECARLAASSAISASD
ncbi:mitotic-spindle organizing 1-like [Brachionus plicatilis]|uniref:Mitotic-spindle organizing 1-like n=1 Tax=Brachionus plicatilis TaxID=10195 RepID=A0A3M7S9R2_BRAPC|nr:mitotic-spindle organizing 1-like [Brachionus plicatilis]